MQLLQSHQLKIGFRLKTIIRIWENVRYIKKFKLVDVLSYRSN